jgi:hypothetical protein
MPDTTVPTRLAAVLPGRWHLQATDYRPILARDRQAAHFEWQLRGTEPLVFDGRGARASEDGGSREVRATLVWRDDHFVWRGRGVLALVSGRVEVAGVSAEGDITAFRFARTLIGPDAILVLARDEVDAEVVRSRVALAEGNLGLEPEEFARLTWLG